MTWYGVATLKRQDNKKNTRYTIYSYSSPRLLMARGSIDLFTDTAAILNERRKLGGGGEKIYSLSPPPLRSL